MTETIDQTQDVLGEDEIADSSTPSLATRLAPVAETALILAGLVLLALGQQHQMIGDGLGRYLALVELLEQGRLSGIPYSLIGPLFAGPLWAVGQLRGDPQSWVGQHNTVLFLLALGALYLLLRRRMDSRTLRRFLLLLVAGSMIAPHLVDFYGEVFTAMAVGVGLVAATVTGARPAIRAAGWIAIVLGVANTPATIGGLLLVAGLLAIRHRRLRYLSVVPATAALIAAESWLRYGDPLHSDYAANSGGQTIMPYSGVPGFSYPFLLGVIAILFSFGKGLLWFIPGLFLPVRRRLRGAAGPSGGADLWSIWSLWMVFVAGLVLVYASWWSWYGGMYWGPRFFLIAILPACLAIAVCLGPGPTGPLADLATLAAVILSGWAAANSFAFAQVVPWTCYQDNYRLEGLCHFTPEFSPLWYPLVAPPELTGVQVLGLTYYGVAVLWLATPLVWRIVRRADVAVRAHRDLLSPTDWRW